jgi:hypothetical protein
VEIVGEPQGENEASNEKQKILQDLKRDRQTEHRLTLDALSLTSQSAYLALSPAKSSASHWRPHFHLEAHPRFPLVLRTQANRRSHFPPQLTLLGTLLMQVPKLPHLSPELRLESTER